MIALQSLVPSSDMQINCIMYIVYTLVFMSNKMVSYIFGKRTINQYYISHACGLRQKGHPVVNKPCSKVFHEHSLIRNIMKRKSKPIGKRTMNQ